MIKPKAVKYYFPLLILSIFLVLNHNSSAQTEQEKAMQLAPFIPKTASAKPAKSRNILIFNTANSYYHAESILWATKAIALTGEKTDAFSTTVTSNPEVFTAQELDKFDAVILNNAMGKYFGDYAQADARKQALINFVQGGKGLIALHATTAFDNSSKQTEAENTLRQIIGGSLLQHPWNYDELNPITIRIEDPKHPVNVAFGGIDKWVLPFQDEIFQITDPFSRDKLRVLLSVSLEETPDKGSNPRKDYPLAWIKEFGKGRVFYSALGHSGDTYRNKELLSFLLAGIQFAIGDLKADVIPVKQIQVDLEKGFESIFNGKNLDGWRGDSKVWRVEDGTITGETTDLITIDKNNFLIWKGGNLENFELKAKFKLISGNSGIYFHSFERTPDEKNQESLVGPQADFAFDHTWVGTIMEYRLREMLAARGQKVVIKEDGKRVDAGKVADPEELLKVYKEGEWNDYHVIVRDNLIVLRINDVEMSELRDYDKTRLINGLLALQVHVGSPMKVQFKDIRIKKF